MNQTFLQYRESQLNPTYSKENHIDNSTHYSISVPTVQKLYSLTQQKKLLSSFSGHQILSRAKKYSHSIAGNRLHYVVFSGYSINRTEGKPIQEFFMKSNTKKPNPRTAMKPFNTARNRSLNSKKPFSKPQENRKKSTR
jgi:hypothetical protein